MSRLVKTAVVQLEFHAAATLANVAHLAEPFVPEAGASLSGLVGKGLAPDSLQMECQDEYVRWHAARLTQILAYLRPLGCDLVVFPEYSIPVGLLGLVHAFASSTGACVFAGTHTPAVDSRGTGVYRKIGLAKKVIGELADLPANASVLPVFNGRYPQVYLKQELSSRERDETSRQSAKSSPPGPLKLKTSGGVTYSARPFICADALPCTEHANDFDIAVVVANDKSPGHFDAFIAGKVLNRHHAVLCNEAHGGGSRVAASVNQSNPDWFVDALNGRLPPGEAILIVDADLDVTAVEVGAFPPARATQLVRVSSIMYSDSQSAAVSENLERARSEAVAARIGIYEEILRDHPNTLQELRTRQLLLRDRQGAPNEDYLHALSYDCRIAGEGALADLERRLATRCCEVLSKDPPAAASRDSAAALTYMRFWKRCNEVAGKDRNVGHDVRPVSMSSTSDILDREAEVRAVQAFLDDASLCVLEVVGLPEIGKSSVLRKALRAPGFGRAKWIRLTETSSSEYLLLSIVGAATPGQVTEAKLVEALRRTPIVVFENTHLLFAPSRAWRDASLESALTAILEAAAVAGAKVVLEGRRQLPLPARNAARRQLLRVVGLDRRLSEHGVALLDNQLRRLQLSPLAVPKEAKERIVQFVGGHPVALAMAADMIFHDGVDAAASAASSHRGSLFTFVETIFRDLALTEQERTLLALASLARVPIPREVLHRVIGAPSVEAMRSLVALAALDVEPDGRVFPASVITKCLDGKSLDADMQKAFHDAATEAFVTLLNEDAEQLHFAVEADFHATLAGISVEIPIEVIDGALASATQLYHQRHYGRAKDLLVGILARKRSLDVLRLAALADAGARDFRAALEHAGEAFAKDPKDDRLLVDLCKVALTQDRTDVIDDLLVLAKRAGMHEKGIAFARGRVELRRNSLAAAEAAFLRALELGPDNAWAHFYLSKIYIRWGRLQDATESAREGIGLCAGQRRLRPVATRLKVQLATAYFLSGNADEAAAIMNEVHGIAPDDAEGVLIRAAVAMRQGVDEDARKAIAALQNMKHRRWEDESRRHLLLGMYFRSKGELDVAIDEFESAVADDRNSVFAHMGYVESLMDRAEALSAEHDPRAWDLARRCNDALANLTDLDPSNEVAAQVGRRLRLRFRDLR